MKIPSLSELRDPYRNMHGESIKEMPAHEVDRLVERSLQMRNQAYWQTTGRWVWDVECAGCSEIWPDDEMTVGLCPECWNSTTRDEDC